MSQQEKKKKKRKRRDASKPGRRSSVKMNDYSPVQTSETVNSNDGETKIVSADCRKVVRDHHRDSRVRECLGLLPVSLSLLVVSWVLSTIFLPFNRRSLAADRHDDALLLRDDLISWLCCWSKERTVDWRATELYPMLEMWCEQTSTRTSLQSLSKMRRTLRSPLYVCYQV